MNYKEMGFRALYHNFCAFKLTDKYREDLKVFPGMEEANCMLTYGYIDQETGLTLEVLALGAENEGKYKFFDPLETASYFIHIRAVENEEFVFFEDTNMGLHQRYKNKLEGLSFYNTNEDVEETRKMGFLDASRNPHHPDEVKVYLLKDGYNKELCQVRIRGLSDHGILGILLEEPKQDFGCHEGEEIAFFVQELQNHSVICYANCNPQETVTAEDLADGSVLKQAIAVFHESRTKDNFVQVMQILRDSQVWIPYNEAQGISDVLQKGDHYFFPAFSSQEEMGQYGVHFSKVKKSFLEVIELAKKNEKNIHSIVMNPFTQSFLLEQDLFEMVESLQSRIRN